MKYLTSTKSKNLTAEELESLDNSSFIRVTKDNYQNYLKTTAKNNLWNGTNEFFIRLFIVPCYDGYILIEIPAEININYQKVLLSYIDLELDIKMFDYKIQFNNGEDIFKNVKPEHLDSVLFNIDIFR